MEKLIEEVRKYPILYDQRHKKYRNAEYKVKVWNTIATNLAINGGGEECKKKWSSIRDQFRRTIQKRKTVSGQAAATPRHYKYEDVLQFLLPHVAERKTISNVADNEEVTNNEIFVDGTLEEEQVIDGDEPESVQEYIKEEPEIQTQEEVFSVKSTANNAKFLKPGLKQKLQHRQSKPQEIASSQLMSYILPEKKTQKRDETEKHPVDAFLYGIAPPLKSLNPILLNEAKGRIFSIVQEYEMKQLRAAQETTHIFSCNQLSPASSPTFAPSPASSESSGHLKNQSQNLDFNE